MKIKRYTLLVLAATLMLVSCRKEPVELLNPNDRVCKTYTQQFETLWHGLDQSYLFWERDTVDWDARYEKYLPIFQEFDTRKVPVSQQEYDSIYQGLFSGLLDHHMMIRVKAPKGNASSTISPSFGELITRPGYHPWTDVMRQLDALQNIEGVTSYTAWEGDDYTPASWFALIPGKNGTKIAYFRFSGFYMYQMWSIRNQLPNKISSQAPAKAFYGSQYGTGICSDGWAANENVSGIIFDVRGNGGGSTADLTPFIGSLMQNDFLLGYSRVKEGPGRLDYSAWTEFWIRRPSNHLPTDKPIVVLADMNSASCAEITTHLIKSMPNGTFIGERTYGATCALTSISQQAFYSGTFGQYDGTPGCYYIYTSFIDMVTADHESLEGKGVVPDIEIPYDQAALIGGSDPQLFEAVRFLKK